LQPGGHVWTEVAMRTNRFAGIKSDKTLWTWGSAFNRVPAGHPGNQAGTYIAAGGDSTIYHNYIGMALSTGDNGRGQLMMSDTTDRVKFEGAQGYRTWTASNRPPLTRQGYLSIGKGGHTLLTDRYLNLWASGNNNHGQLGNDSIVNSIRAVRIDGDMWVSLKAGEFHSMGIKDSDIGLSLFTWGYNGNGQLGFGDLVDRHVPTYLMSADMIGAGYSHCIARSANKVYTWGNNTYGQLGDGTWSGSLEPIEITIPGSGDIVGVWAGGYCSFAARDNGDLYAWGRGHKGQLGLGTTGDKNIPQLVPRPDIFGVTRKWAHVPGLIDDAISSGDGHTLMLTESVAPVNLPVYMACGDNSSGQLGIGSHVDKLSPTPVILDASDNSYLYAIAVAAGADHTIILRGCEGTVPHGLPYTAGANFVGQLGLNDLDHRENLTYCADQVMKTIHGAYNAFAGIRWPY